MSWREVKPAKNGLQEHFSDRYVRMAKEGGFRSRASFKLAEIQHRDRIIHPGMTVVDLGAAPGGWSQVSQAIVGPRGRVLATDILPMDPLPGVDIVMGDFTDDAVLQAIMEGLAGRKADLVISDMAPNLSGVRAVDQPRAMYLAELALDMATQVLTPGGTFLTKVFHGEGFEPYLRLLRNEFDKVVTRKPESSRARSRETYLLAKGFCAERQQGKGQ